MDTKPQKIYADLIKLRKHIGGLEAKKTDSGPKFAIKNAKELMIKFRKGLDDLDMVSWVSEASVTDIQIEPYLDKYGNRKAGSGCLVTSKVVVASDDGSFVVFTGMGHGFDTDDKAAGKASTYAWKDALIKGLNLPDAEMASISTETVDTDDESDIPVTRKPSKVDAAAAQVDAIKTRLDACQSPEQVKALSDEVSAMGIKRNDAQPLVRAFAEARARVGAK